MANVTPIGEFTPVIRQNYFENQFNVDPTAGETILTVTCVDDAGIKNGIEIITTTSSVIIRGSYLDKDYLDTATFVSKGSSNLLEQPTTVTGISNIPQNKDMYEYKQDLSPDRQVYYTITVESMSLLLIPMSETFTIWHWNKNDWSSGTAFVKKYYGT